MFVLHRPARSASSAVLGPQRLGDRGGEGRIAALSNAPTSRPSAARRRSRLAGGLAAVMAVGLLTVGVQSLRAQEDPTPVPVVIAALEDDSVTAVTGQVAEIFGNKFILTDPGGRALIETGRAGEAGTLVARDEVVTVQARFHRGFLHASRIVHADGRVDELHPPHPPHHGPKHDDPHAPTPAAQR